MSKEGFIKNNRGTNEGQDFPPEFLTSIYDDIYIEEIRMKDEIDTSMLLRMVYRITIRSSRSSPAAEFL
jgi:Sec7-like guanine-nucleotide exchange factor